MLLNNDILIAGPFDVIGIVKNISTGRFHAYLFEYRPFPGGEPPKSIVRLRSKMHHTGGAETFEEAVDHVAKMREQVSISDENVWITLDKVMEQDFAKDGHAIVTVVANWKSDRSESGQEEAQQAQEHPVD